MSETKVLAFKFAPEMLPEDVGDVMEWGIDLSQDEEGGLPWTLVSHDVSTLMTGEVLLTVLVTRGTGGTSSQIIF